VSRRRIDPLDVALGEVRPQDEAEVARLLREDERFRRDVEGLAPVVARLERQPAETWRAEEPPPLVVGAPPPPPRRRVWRHGLVLRPAFALAATVLLLVAGAGIGLLAVGGDGEDGGAPAGRVVALEALRAGAHGEAVVSGESVRVRVGGLPAEQRGGFYELWLLNSPRDLVSLGTFRVGADGTAQVTLPVGVDPARFAFIDVSAEPADGDPAYSGASVLRAPV
jgi:anti-sigma-K factor RskA